MAELRNIKWGPFLQGLVKKDALPALTKSHSLQWWLTIGLRKQGFCIIDQEDGITFEFKGIRFNPEPLNYPRFIEAPIRYPSLEKITEEDIVFDFGANTGSYSVPAASIGAKVVSVEPLYSRELLDNIKLNGLDTESFTLLPCAVNCIEYPILKVDCQGKKGVAIGVTPRYLYRLSPTVLRVDIGGGEWGFKNLEEELIPPTVKLLEVEFHFFTQEQKLEANLDSWLLQLRLLGFSYLGRWSTRKNWFYLSAERNNKNSWKIVNLIDGSFTGKNLRLWRGLTDA